MAPVSDTCSPPWDSPTEIHKEVCPDDDDDDSPPPPPPQVLAPTPPTLLHLSFNQDHCCFAAATDNGFRIYDCHPFRELIRREFGGGNATTGGFILVEMIFRCNVLALVGDGTHPQYPPTKVVIWDDYRNECNRQLPFPSIVLAVRLRRDRIIVVVEQMVFVYNFHDYKLLHQIETIANPRGLCVVSQSPDSILLACPGLRRGQIRVEHYSKRITNYIWAHDSAIACLALTLDGLFLATASTKGTLIRIFDTNNGSMLQEVRRGANPAVVYSLAFSSTAQWFAVTSDKGTVHVFSRRANSSSSQRGNSQTTTDSRAASAPSSSPLGLGKFKEVLPKYFYSQRSLAQFHLHEGTHYTVAFGQQSNMVMILGMDGSFYRFQFDPEHGGDMIVREFHNFLVPGTAS